MPGQPLVSVIITTYNRVALLKKAVESAINQDYPNKQIIVIDDGSEDDTRQLMQLYTEVEYYHQANKGQAAARNSGLGKAKGQFIATLDSDDCWAPDFLTRGVKKLEDDQLDFVFTNWTYRVNEHLSFNYLKSFEPIKHHYTSTATDWVDFDYNDLRSLYLSCCPSPSSSLIIRRSSAAASWNEELSIADDWCMLLDIVLSGKRKAAFNKQELWTKNRADNNVYDGRNDIDVTRLLYVQDLRLLIKRFRHKLSAPELEILQELHITGLIKSAKYGLLKQRSGPRKIISPITEALKMSTPITMLSLLRLLKDTLSYRLGKLFRA